ncbi:MAG: N-acetylmuramidase domain-containing protein [Roseomonas mucosa]|nr:N-acetylmuramidase domain-containing protein [Roseomonas mucosa]
MTNISFSGPATPLRPGDIGKAARLARLEPALVRAVTTVETGGSGGFLADGSGRPRILFEAHRFSKNTAGRFDKVAPTLSVPKWTPGLYKGGAAEYDRLAAAAKLDSTAALKSCSWGMFQIMGENHKACGFPDVESYVTAMASGEGAQLEAFIAFIVTLGLDDALRERRWAAFASRYNGTGYRENQYDTKLEQAYRREVDGEPADGVLRVGSKGARVTQLQRAINAALGTLHLNLAPLAPDGVFGRVTEIALRAVQAASGLTADGVAGNATTTALKIGDFA